MNFITTLITTYLKRNMKKCVNYKCKTYKSQSFQNMKSKTFHELKLKLMLAMEHYKHLFEFN